MASGTSENEGSNTEEEKSEKVTKKKKYKQVKNLKRDVTVSNRLKKAGISKPVARESKVKGEEESVWVTMMTGILKERKDWKLD